MRKATRKSRSKRPALPWLLVTPELSDLDTSTIDTSDQDKALSDTEAANPTFTQLASNDTLAPPSSSRWAPSALDRARHISGVLPPSASSSASEPSSSPSASSSPHLPRRDWCRWSHPVRPRLPYLRKIIKKRRESEKKLTCQAQAGEDDLQDK